MLVQLVMNRYLSEWSLTRRRIFTNCARRFAKQYFFAQKAKKHQSNKKRFVAYSDLMIKSTRTVLFELLTDLHNGTIWTDKVLISKMRFAVNVDLLSNRQLKIPIKRKNQIIIHGYKQIKKLMKQKILRKIADNSISEWSFYNRIKSTKFGHLDVYCSPDIVYRSGSMWHLVRLNFQSENKQPFLDLELTTMLLWSKGNQYLPNLADKFVIHGISYSRGKWIHKKVIPNQQLLQETKQLLEKDVHNFNLLFQQFYRSNDYDSLPLTKSKLYCRRCPYKLKCPINSE